MRDILEQINRINGVRGSLVVGPDGLPVVTNLPTGEDANRLAARAATVSQTLKGTTEKLSLGSMNRYIMNGSEGSAVLLVLNNNAQILVLLRRDINMGLVLVELKQAAEKLGERIQL
ncbi:MAG: roadblock/LC7 domain-containing protein [Planctomycetota bacterium]|jgi:predicted regulator of Ras-like GTPase activity (Roadblock/LC7/MglB family)